MDTLLQQSREDKIQFRCPEDWKREVSKRLIDMGETTKQAGIKALSRYTGVPLPESISDDPGDFRRKGRGVNGSRAHRPPQDPG